MFETHLLFTSGSVWEVFGPIVAVVVSALLRTISCQLDLKHMISLLSSDNPLLIIIQYSSYYQMSPGVFSFQF